VVGIFDVDHVASSKKVLEGGHGCGLEWDCSKRFNSVGCVFSEFRRCRYCRRVPLLVRYSKRLAFVQIKEWMSRLDNSCTAACYVRWRRKAGARHVLVYLVRLDLVVLSRVFLPSSSCLGDERSSPRPSR
jgi:hypothetical protein